MKKIRLLHIPKTGGTNISRSLHKGRHLFFNICNHDVIMDDVNFNYIFTVRDPIERFVSGYISRLRKGRPTYNQPHTLMEKACFDMFPTPNDIAEAMYESEEAMTFMNNILHLKHSLTYYLISPEHVTNFKDNITHVLVTKNLQDSFNDLCDKLVIPHIPLYLPSNVNAHKTPDIYLGMFNISEKAKENLRKHYTSDYKIIETLFELNKIDSKYKIGDI